MERWEPPRTTEPEPPRPRRSFPQVKRPDLPEIWLMVAMRLGITLVIAAAVFFDALRAQMHFVAVVIIAGLLVVMYQSDRVQTQRLRRQTMLDLFMLITVVPVAVLNAFVAAEPDELLPAEQAALLQTAGGLLIVLGLAVWLATYLFDSDRTLQPALLIPGLLVVLSLTFVLHDYRNQTALAMIAVSYFLGACAVGLGAGVDEPVRRHVPLAFYGSTLLAGMVLFDPGIQNIFEREGLVQVTVMLMILVSIVLLIVLPNPTLQELRPMPARNAGERSESASSRERTQRRESDDPAGNIAERG